jgi:hypothetical protein
LPGRRNSTRPSKSARQGVCVIPHKVSHTSWNVTLGPSFNKPAIKKNTIHKAERGGWSVDVIANLPLFFQP